MTAPTPTYQMLLFSLPSAMKRTQAAANCGVSAGHFDRMVSEGVLPEPRNLGGVKVWLRQEMDDALFALNDSAGQQGRASCDAAFNM